MQRAKCFFLVHQIKFFLWYFSTIVFFHNHFNCLVDVFWVSLSQFFISALNFYDQIKVVNFIRRSVHQSICVCCRQRFENGDCLSEHLATHSDQMAGSLDRKKWDESQWVIPFIQKHLYNCICKCMVLLQTLYLLFLQVHTLTLQESCMVCNVSIIYQNDYHVP